MLALSLKLSTHLTLWSVIQPLPYDPARCLMYCLGIPGSVFRRLVANHIGNASTSKLLLRSHITFPYPCRHQARGAFKVSCFTKVSGLMATPDSDQEFQDAMNALGTLISGKARGDGKTWKDAFDYMQVYLEVSRVIVCCW